MTLTKRSYNTTIIIDTRDQEKPAQELIEDVKTTLETMDVEIEETVDLGRRDFARVTDANFPSGHYFLLMIKAPTFFADRVVEKFRLDKTVYRIMVQSYPKVS